MIFRSVAALAGALAAASAVAAQPAEQANSAVEAVSPSPAAPDATETLANVDANAEKKVCRTEKITGSLSRRNRICLTETQWREVYDRTRRGVGDMQNGASGGKECIVDEFGGCRVTVN